MRRCWIAWLLPGCGLAVAICAVALNSDHEPRYGGRSLSQWLLIHRQAQIEGRHTIDWWAVGSFQALEGPSLQLDPHQA